MGKTNKQSLLIAVAFLMLFLSTVVKGQNVTEILLYPDNPEFKPENRKEEKNFDADGLRNVFGLVVPRIIVYKPEKSFGSGLIYCPGGGFSTLFVRNARFVAERLNRMGVTVFVLIYRLPAYELKDKKNEEGKDKKLDAPLQDVQAAFRLVRSRADEWGINKDKIGIGGGSAGGHLAAMAATHYTTSYIPGTDTTGLRPDFLVLNWSGGTGEGVNSRTPATFLVHANDDPVTNPINSIRFYEALKKSNVPVELHIYEKGGHGFGIDPDIKDSDSWMTQLEIWMRKRGLL